MTLDDSRAVTPAVDVDMLEFVRALTELASFDPRKSQIAELRFFAGLSLAETGKALGISLATVEATGKPRVRWLFKTLSGRRP